MTFSQMPDPDWLPPTPPWNPPLIPCVICSTLSASETCDVHALLWVIRGLVRIGEKSDWTAQGKPSHNDMMTLPTRGHGSIGWRAELATLLAINGVWLDDSGKDDLPHAGWGSEWDM